MIEAKTSKANDRGQYKLRAALARRDRLIENMVKTFDDLGRDAMARIDARVWYQYYYRAMRRLPKP